MQIHIAVRCSAKTAAIKFTQHLAALLCCCGHIQQVPAQRSQEILIYGGAVSLEDKQRNVNPG